MFKDQSLLPAEAIRLAALGLLADGPRRYGDLATEIRSFIGLAVGPSLDLMGSSIELLRYEGLATAQDDMLTLAPAGAVALTKLLQAPLRAPNNDAGRLVLLLKLRFLHHLDADEQTAQRARIADSLAAEMARLEELRRLHADAAPLLRNWLDHEIAEIADRIGQFRHKG
jgi:Putative AphA-like transcriptional regulator